jgi:PRTRC genetic system protein C
MAALEFTSMTRTFTFKKKDLEVKLDDPNPTWDAQQVLNFYTAQYPELNNATVEGPKVKGNQAHYTVSTKAGQLG